MQLVRLILQVLTESLLLSLLGGSLALVLLLWGMAGIRAVSPADLPRLDNVQLNVPVFAFAVLSSLACGLLFGALPAWRAARHDVAGVINSSRTAGSLQHRRSLAALLVGEVALTIVLLTGAGLTARSLYRLAAVDTGFEKSNLLGSFAGLATLLAMVGTYGVLAYGVGRQTREIGIRLALGAQPRAVLPAVVGEGMKLVGVGMAIGLLAAAGLSRTMRSLLFEVAPGDPLSYVLAAAALLLVALCACWGPARRAARVDPMVALRHE